MKAIILAAGLGSRLMRETRNKPKCLVKINNNPLIFHQLEALRKAGITDIIIVIGYQKEKIVSFVNSYNEDLNSSLNINFVVNDKFDLSNSSYSFWVAKDYVRGSSYIHLNCDVLFDVNIITKLIDSNYKNIIVVDTSTNLTEGSMEQVILQNDRIIKMDNRNVRNASGKGAGIAKISSDCLEWLINKIERYIKHGDLDQNYYTFIRDAIHYNDFYGFKTENSFIKEMNTIEELEEAKVLLNQKI